MFKNIKKRIAQNKTIQRLASSQLFKRTFIGFVIFAALVTAIIPTWQIYLEEGRSSTLISYSDPNIKGESLYISATVLDVDFTGKKYKVNFMIQPNGTLANDYGQLSQPITLRFSSLKTYHIDAGDALNPIQVEFNYVQGDEIDYPFDYYSGFFQLSAYYLNDTTQSIPITFHLEASITSFHFMPTLVSDTIVSANDDKIALKIITGRSTTTMGFSIFTCILMWLLSILMGLFAYQVVFRKRRADAHACMIGITTLFALPAVRSAQPGIPQVGCVSDILGFYWNMVIIACSSIGIILCWIIRWDSHFHEHEESGVKHRSMFSEYPPTRQYNRNESCTSVMTCVEPSLQNE